MKTLCLLLFSSLAMVALTGCDDSKPKSMAEDLELSDIEAYEKEVAAMETEDAGGMDMKEK